MRHIPDDELHAYFDQALSRSQCVEIERHLSDCPRCQASRDQIAALRDRTTAILARLGPELVIPPSYDRIVARLAEFQAQRAERIRRAAWAATLLLAVGLGWQANRWIHQQRTGPVAPAALASSMPATPVIPASIRDSEPAPAREAPTVAPKPSKTSRPESKPRPQPAAPKPEPQLRRASPADGLAEGYEPVLTTRSPLVVTAAATTQAPSNFPEFEVSRLPGQPDDDDLMLLGLWRLVAPDSLGTTVPAEIPRVPGMPVIQWRVQPGENGDDVNAVDQLLENGQVIRTISGPARRVAQLVDAEEDLAERTGGAVSNTDRMTLTVRQGDRMLALSGPAQILGSLLQRVSSARRY